MKPWNSKNPSLDRSTQKNEMETSDENRIVIGRKVGNPELSMKYKTNRAVGRPRKNEKMKSITSSDQKELRMPKQRGKKQQ